MRFTAVALAATLAFVQASSAELAVEKRGLFDFLIPGGGLPESGMSCGYNRNLVGVRLGGANTCDMVNGNGGFGRNGGGMRCGGADSLVQADISQYNGCSMYSAPSDSFLSPGDGFFAKSTDDKKAAAENKNQA
ncbi:hypothetical protein PTTG_05378 [Puccinia triticina 1-1 BBBD Race 1]|uniref:Uncharacterized protein n=1 Tax=Puccinia triticina (isolate 1-1 / race 1 (BBBD)) TaxID=630390 RepID=A0A0C4EX31_PUCT1|nr:hypothetical protein PTTG_05378 [Puccinia triticina 1-1 BBBD Race 1]WAR63654.1 hypothetical protein PtB15_17B255 [Puccinia triticina]